MNLQYKIIKHFEGKVVRKDLTKMIKGNAVVPSYVLEYLLGQHCAVFDKDIIEKGLEKVYIHAILDGRDTPPDSGIGYMRQLQKYLEKIKTGRIATICGRFYAMDRDTRWDRTEKAFRLYTEGKGVQEAKPVEAVQNAYNRKETDEFIKPIIICPEGTVKDGDSIVFFNFRADRARQITRAFTDPDFQGFQRNLSPEFSGYACMTVYDEILQSSSREFFFAGGGAT